MATHPDVKEAAEQVELSITQMAEAYAAYKAASDAFGEAYDAWAEALKEHHPESPAARRLGIICAR